MEDNIGIQGYLYNLLLNFILEQLFYFQNSKKVIDSQIKYLRSLSDGIIVHDIIPITDIPEVQMRYIFDHIE